MNPFTRIALLTAVSMNLLLADAAWAEPPATPPGDGGRQWHQRHGERKQARAERLEALHGALKLNQEQEAAWKTWVDQAGEHRGQWKDKKADWQAWANLPAIERMEAIAKKRQEKFEARIAATKTFYATLTPEQRQVFDQQFKPWYGRHGGGRGPGPDVQ